MHPLNDALPAPYVPLRVTRGALGAHRHTYAPPPCRTSQYLSIGWYCGAGVFGLIGFTVYLSLSALHCRSLLIIIIIIQVQ